MAASHASQLTAGYHSTPASLPCRLTTLLWLRAASQPWHICPGRSMRQLWPVNLQALYIMLSIQGMQVISDLAGLSAHLMELMTCDTGSAVYKSWTGPVAVMKAL